MSGYREHSYDPNASPRYGKPLRPFNWVQWTGVALGVVGLALYAAYFAGRFGWFRQELDSPMLGFAFLMFGVVLVNSRREQSYDPAPELAPARKRWMILTLVIVAAVLGAALVIEFSGA